MLSVTNCGLVSSLGLDMKIACAASRSGLVRPTVIATGALDMDTLDAKEQIGYVVPIISEGFRGPARMAVIGIKALEDLAYSEGKSLQDSNFWQDTTLGGRHWHVDW